MAAWYDDYLKSEHWRETRIRRLMLARIERDWELFGCEHEGCGLFVPPQAIDIHHLTYERLGNERMEDLKILCRSCHGVTHGFSPKPWWERAKEGGRTMVTKQSYNLDRNLKRIGDVMQSCLAYHDIRHVSLPFQVAGATR